MLHVKYFVAVLKLKDVSHKKEKGKKGKDIPVTGHGGP
jgi:hypothetical protein